MISPGDGTESCRSYDLLTGCIFCNAVAFFNCRCNHFYCGISLQEHTCHTVCSLLFGALPCRIFHPHASFPHTSGSLLSQIENHRGSCLTSRFILKRYHIAMAAKADLPMPSPASPHRIDRSFSSFEMDAVSFLDEDFL